MVVITRQPGETVHFKSNEEEITIKLLVIGGNQAKLGISSPNENKILRKELLKDDTECCF